MEGIGTARVPGHRRPDSPGTALPSGAGVPGFRPAGNTPASTGEINEKDATKTIKPSN